MAVQIQMMMGKERERWIPNGEKKSYKLVGNWAENMFRTLMNE
jgi:hypothetical protein